MISPDGDSSSEGKPVPSLVKAIARAHSWYKRIVAREISSIDQLAQKSGLTRRYVRRILQFGYLSPQITEAVLTGKHRPNLTLKEFLRGVPLDWEGQETKLLRPY